MAIFFTSDTHFGDARILQIAKRPFTAIALHDAALIARWNETVGPEDEVWHLGDFARTSAHERVTSLLAGLNGRKRLIIGNNDGAAALASPGWDSIQYYAEISLEGRLCVLCHYPFRTWSQMGKGSINLHGHSHAMLKPLPRQADVGVDAWDYRPVTLETILATRRRKAARA